MLSLRLKLLREQPPQNKNTLLARTSYALNAR